MTDQEMFEVSFQRSSNYFKLSGQRRWEIDEFLGILDWIGDLTDKEQKRFEEHYQ